MLVIGIAGGSGSGKTTVVNKIIERFSVDKIAVLPQDNYYRDLSHLPLEIRQQQNFDHPNAIEFELLIEHVKHLKQGISILMPTYSYHTCQRLSETIFIKPLPVVIIEGILIFTNKELRDLMDIKIFVDADADDRLIRIIERDTRERGRDVNKVIERYLKTVKPSHVEFIEPTKAFADIIIPQGGHNLVAIDIIVQIIENKLKQ
ncbi:MAG: uridine kinase [Bacteroidales bacterium]|nr:uridine kinase [Bacteroidales bacterium]